MGLWRLLHHSIRAVLARGRVPLQINNKNMDIIKVIELHAREGKPMRNQYVLRCTDGDYLQSYDSIIAFIPARYGDAIVIGDGKIKLDPEYYNYSQTTAKARDIFLQIDRETFKKNLEAGIYIMESLNKNK